jgi:23S rRNA pseudouridine1911/1915/1917 synthase
MSPEPLAVIWEDPYGLTVVKPAGLLTQGRAGGEETLEDRVRRYLNADDPASVYLGTVHRLDRPVSGVVLWAKTPKSARRWADQFARRSVCKEYWALVEARDDLARLATPGTWDDYLAPPDALGRARVVGADDPGATRAVTHFAVGGGTVTTDGVLWLKLRPETGRTHQLRAQAAAHGFPIVGDQAYGATLSFPAGIALHARSLTVEHPVIKRPIVAEAPLPESWAGWLVSGRA